MCNTTLTVWCECECELLLSLWWRSMTAGIGCGLNGDKTSRAAVCVRSTSSTNQTVRCQETQTTTCHILKVLMQTGKLFSHFKVPEWVEHRRHDVLFLLALKLSPHQAGLLGTDWQGAYTPIVFLDLHAECGVCHRWAGLQLMSAEAQQTTLSRCFLLR